MDFLTTFKRVNIGISEGKIKIKLDVGKLLKQTSKKGGPINSENQRAISWI